VESGIRSVCGAADALANPFLAVARSADALANPVGSGKRRENDSAHTSQSRSALPTQRPPMVLS